MRSRTWKLARLAFPIGLIPLFACLSPPVESPRTTVTQETSVRVEQNIKNKVDILFVIDNSLSTSPIQAQFRVAFPQLILRLDDFAAKGSPASYHIGVVNSDLGAGTLNAPAPNGGGCVPGGSGGKLQTGPTAACPPTGLPAACSTFTPGGGLHYLDYNQLNNTNNLGGVSLPDAFSCISAVGDCGCGFEHVLESAYRALHDPIPENVGFLRNDAILAVVFITNEDDCSAPPNSDLFDPNLVNMYGVWHSFRCTQFGVECGGTAVQPMTASNLTGCGYLPTAQGGKLLDLDKYFNFFGKGAALGGVKVNPDDVIVVGVTAASEPLNVQVTTPCADSNAPSCPVIVHGCTQPGNNLIYGDNGIRLNSVVNSARHKSLTSICDTDYNAAINALGDLIISQIGAGCLNAPVVYKPDGTPDCVVEDVTTNPDGSETIKEIPYCGASAPTCWRLVDKLGDYNGGACYVTPQPTTCMLPSSCQPVVKASHLADNPPVDCTTGAAAPSDTCELDTVTIDRGGGMAPPNTFARVSCATVASSTR
jgi:hypothetical protein